MTTVSVLYKVDESEDLNCFELQHPHDRLLLLSHLMSHFARAGLDCSSFESRSQGAYFCVDSLATVLPVEGGCVYLRLSPAAAPPHTPVHQAVDFLALSDRMCISDRPMSASSALSSSSANVGKYLVAGSSGGGRPEPYSRSSDPSSGRSSEGRTIDPSFASASTGRSEPFSSPSRPEPYGGTRRSSAESDEGSSRFNQQQQSRGPALNDLVSKESITALGEAGLEAGKKAAQFADAASKTLFSFATKGLKSLTEGAATLQTVKLNRQSVSIKRQLAEGGFGTVYIASSGSNRGDFALKKLNCQSREQIDEANEVSSRFGISGKYFDVVYRSLPHCKNLATRTS
jgi:hypothetical protein